MPTYIPTVTTFVSGVVSVSSTDGTSYATILNSMGSYVYLVQNLYMKANSNAQILEGFAVEQYDVNGYIKSFNQKPAIDPYQYQKSLFFKLVKENIVLNGQTTFDMNILPNEVLYIYHNQRDKINSNGGNLVCEPLETYIKGRDIISVTKTKLNNKDLSQMYEVLKGYKYDFINFNCEHFVNFATDKKLISNQVFRWGSILAIGILVTYLIRKNKL
jgi:hypothetical protein